MAQKKAARSSTKKGSTSKAPSKTKSKPKTVAIAKKKVSVKSKTTSKSTSKTKPASPLKKATTSKTKKTSIVKGKPKSPTAKKSSTTKKTAKQPSASSRKKKTSAQRTPVTSPKKTVEKVKSKISSKKPAKNTKKVSMTPRAKAPKKPATKPSASPNPKATNKANLTPLDRYNIGGLLACAIDQAEDPGLLKFRKALKHLALSAQEQENLIRVTQGFMFPKLFADEIKEESTRELAVKELLRFAKTEDNYERDWQSDIKQFAIWLGIAI